MIPVDDPMVIRFPEGVTDADGRRLRPGSVVRVVSDGSIPVAEVTGMSGDGRRVVVLTDGDPFEFFEVDPDDLRTVGARLDVPVTTGELVVQGDQERCTLVLPVGAQEVQLKVPGRPGPFPDPGEFRSERVTATKVNARWWGEALVTALEAMTPDERGEAAAEYLDAPILRRVLNEAAVPLEIDRVLLVATDQEPVHRDDTLPFASVIEEWLAAVRPRLRRRMTGDPATIVLRQAPHLLAAVEQQVEEALPSLVDRTDRLVVVAAGGTPAMTYGTMLAAMATGLPVRHLQVPFDQPLVELDLDPLLGKALRLTPPAGA